MIRVKFQEYETRRIPQHAVQLALVPIVGTTFEAQDFFSKYER